MVQFKYVRSFVNVYFKSADPTKNKLAKIIKI